jgi:hypothetical protein
LLETFFSEASDFDSSFPSLMMLLLLLTPPQLPSPLPPTFSRSIFS